MSVPLSRGQLISCSASTQQRRSHELWLWDGLKLSHAPWFKSRSAQSQLSSLRASCWAGCVLFFWWFPLNELYVCPSMWSEAEAVSEHGLVPEYVYLSTTESYCWHECVHGLCVLVHSTCWQACKRGTVQRSKSQWMPHNTTDSDSKVIPKWDNYTNSAISACSSCYIQARFSESSAFQCKTAFTNCIDKLDNIFYNDNNIFYNDALTETSS
jgi:hypothetical protein